MRGSDLACRYGGEEFVIALPKAGLEMTRQRAENLRRKAAELEVEHRGRVLNKVTLSLGVAVFPTHGANWQATLKAADVALYRAKSGGRNRVEMALAGEVAAADSGSLPKPG